MDVYLIRHAIAFDPNAEAWPDDRQRPLTKEGARRFKKAARGLREIAPRVDSLLSSGYVRAWATAQSLAAEAKWPNPVEFSPLEPGHSPAEVLVKLVEQSGLGSIALVGHEPSLHELATYLTAGAQGATNIIFKKGGAACVHFDEDLRQGAGALAWLASPRLLRKLA